MRRFFYNFILILILASCAPKPDSVPTRIPSPTVESAPTHAPEIRFALIGSPQDINVWQLFDESGASYANYALRFEYWPRLYQLVPPEFNFAPLAAEGMPSPVIADGEGFSATVTLRSNLKWTDGTAFTAEDIAFTVNTALKYELGYDWASYYGRDVLDRVEAIDSQTVKFYFKIQPNIESWQYGALQGPIVQRAYWESRIVEPASLLPDEKLIDDIQVASGYVDNVQAQVDDLQTKINVSYANGQGDGGLTGTFTKRQDELQYAKNVLDDLQVIYEGKIDSAQEALYAIDDAGEPTLGTWMPAGGQNGVWTNEANPDFPFTQPNFDRAIYFTFDDESSALSAFENNIVDVILAQNGLASPATVTSPSNRVRFLVFNPNEVTLADLAIRHALACVSGYQQSFVQTSFLQNADAMYLCANTSAEQKIQSAVDLMKSAGYTWVDEPKAGVQGVGLTLPDGSPFPHVNLLALSADMDAEQASAAEAVEQAALQLGIPISVEYTDSSGLQYAVFSSKKYDLAILGWKLSQYPSYLCDWFGVGGPFENNNDRLKSACEALAVESVIEKARAKLFEVQSILVEELPFIPLYEQKTHDAFQNVGYPFDEVPGGLSGLYGAPSYAMPAK